MKDEKAARRRARQGGSFTESPLVANALLDNGNGDGLEGEATRVRTRSASSANGRLLDGDGGVSRS